MVYSKTIKETEDGKEILVTEKKGRFFERARLGKALRVITGTAFSEEALGKLEMFRFLGFIERDDLRFGTAEYLPSKGELRLRSPAEGKVAVLSKISMDGEFLMFFGRKKGEEKFRLALSLQLGGRDVNVAESYDGGDGMLNLAFEGEDGITSICMA